MVKWYTDWKVRVGWSLGKYSGRSTVRDTQGDAEKLKDAHMSLGIVHTF